ncbi:hypothetical protein QDW14_07955 [Corynebacterium bovis]|uniref:hypothetical protein n=1 Tax=Corynebacterium bovis TaxID=36808 RepID=UPI002449EC24|nr:hypothetical protein [Corynebacterium bovis]MDH2456404.1 hypothetical protein [Corynebacterium bovis]
MFTALLALVLGLVLLLAAVLLFRRSSQVQVPQRPARPVTGGEVVREGDDDATRPSPDTPTGGDAPAVGAGAARDAAAWDIDDEWLGTWSGGGAGGVGPDPAATPADRTGDSPRWATAEPARDTTGDLTRDDRQHEPRDLTWGDPRDEARDLTWDTPRDTAGHGDGPAGASAVPASARPVSSGTAASAADAAAASAAGPADSAGPAPSAPSVPSAHPAPSAPSAASATSGIVDGAAVPVVDAGSSSPGRRQRRHWAQQHGFEYTREDADLPGEWPASVIDTLADQGRAPVARDVVSGVVGGHPAHVADVGGVTVVAVRRDEGSPVSVHATRHAGMPAGMRHGAELDRPPFTLYATDLRALDRMLDTRADAALRAVEDIAADVALADDWALVRLRPRLDVAVWADVIDRVILLADAARVLPPWVTSVPLDMLHADPTTALDGDGVHVETRAPGDDDAAGRSDAGESGGTGGTAAAGAETGTDTGAGTGAATGVRGHLRAVPDARGPHDRATAGDGDDADGTTGYDATAYGTTGYGATAYDVAGATGYGATADGAGGDTADATSARERPYITRSAEPVDLPRRDGFRRVGDTAGIDDRPPGDPLAGEGDLPLLGEDPEHIRVPTTSPRVIRTDRGHGATIFDDDGSLDGTGTRSGTAAGTAADADADAADATPGTGARGGRHRAPAGRHWAGDGPHGPGSGRDGEDPDGVLDAEIVEAEIVDPRTVRGRDGRDGPHRP